MEKGGFKTKGWISNKQSHNDDTEGMKIFQGDVEEKVPGIVWKTPPTSLHSRSKLIYSSMQVPKIIKGKAARDKKKWY